MNNKVIVFEEWVANYGDYLFHWAISKTKSKELSEDLVQETFIAGFKNYEKFENRSSPKTWLIAILNNKIIDHYRKSNVQVSYATLENNGQILTDALFDKDNFWLNELDSTIWENEISVDNTDVLEQKLLSCINNLPEKWNLAISYKYFTDKKAAEICQELEITVSNYWQIIHRAKLLLKKCIEK
jgi:RNA polymerase sigma-70 factor (ECF subfamily)